MSDYRVPLWPLRVVNGDFVTGDRQEAIRSAIGVVLDVRKFIDINIPGEYVMRPNAFSAIPFQLIAPFDVFSIGPLTEAYILEALSHLEARGKIRVVSMRTTVISGGVVSKIVYEIPATGERNEYDYVAPAGPSGSTTGRSP